MRNQLMTVKESFGTIRTSQKKVDEKTIEKIQAILKNEKKENVINDAKLAPAWINKILM